MAKVLWCGREEERETDTRRRRTFNFKRKLERQETNGPSLPPCYCYYSIFCRIVLPTMAEKERKKKER